MNKNITISVVMTAYNASETIIQAIESVIASTHKDWELIIVNDSSTDDTLAKAEALAHTDERIRIITHTTNQGAGMARRTGIEASSGDYVITIDSDDSITPSFLSNLALRAMETDADIVSGGITIRHTDEDYTETKSWGNRISEGEQKFLDYNSKRIIFLNNKIVRRTMYATAQERELGTEGKVVYCGRRYCEDTPVIVPLLYYANKVAYCSDSGYIYNMRDSSLTHTVHPFEENLYKALCAAECIKFFSDKPDYHKFVPSQDLVTFSRNAKAYATPELIQQYINDWVKLSMHIIDLI